MIHRYQPLVPGLKVTNILIEEDTSLCPGPNEQYRRPEVCYLLKLGGLFIKAFPANVH